MTRAAPPKPADQLTRVRAAMEAPSNRVVFVNVPMCNFLMIEGHGGVREPAFREALTALTDLSAALRLYLQSGSCGLLDPMPVEILWSRPDDEVWRDAVPEGWSWTAMVAQPSAVTPELVAAVSAGLEHDHRPGGLHRVHLGSLREGLCAQTAYSARSERSQEVAARLHDHLRAHGFEPHGPYHEIHVADLRHRDVAALRTIVRQPVRHA